MCRKLESQLPPRYQLSLAFLKSFTNTAEVELFNFQDSRKKSDFDHYYMKKHSLSLPEKVAGNQNMCEKFQNISSLADILVVPLKYLKDLRTSA